MPSATPRDLAAVLRVEMARSRRHRQPLSVAVLSPVADSSTGPRRGRGRLTARLRKVLPQHVRVLDAVAVDRARAFVVAPGAPRAGAHAMADRLRAVAAAHGVALAAEVSTFPEDAVVADDLLTTAAQPGPARRQAQAS